MDLTYRTDLIRLNDDNFARFDAKLEQRIAELRSEMRVEFAAQRSWSEREFAAVRSELGKIHENLNSEIHETRLWVSQQLTANNRWMIGLWMTSILAIMSLWLRK